MGSDQRKELIRRIIEPAEEFDLAARAVIRGLEASVQIGRLLKQTERLTG